MHRNKNKNSIKLVFINEMRREPISGWKHSPEVYTRTCCNRLLIGKTYWKEIALPSILIASEIIDYSEKELIKRQIIENLVYKTIYNSQDTQQTGP